MLKMFAEVRKLSKLKPDDFVDITNAEATANDKYLAVANKYLGFDITEFWDPEKTARENINRIESNTNTIDPTNITNLEIPDLDMHDFVVDIGDINGLDLRDKPDGDAIITGLPKIDAIDVWRDSSLDNLVERNVDKLIDSVLDTTTKTSEKNLGTLGKLESMDLYTTDEITQGYTKFLNSDVGKTIETLKQDANIMQGGEKNTLLQKSLKPIPPTADQVESAYGFFYDIFYAVRDLIVGKPAENDTYAKESIPGIIDRYFTPDSKLDFFNTIHDDTQNRITGNAKAFVGKYATPEDFSSQFEDVKTFRNEPLPYEQSVLTPTHLSTSSALNLEDLESLGSTPIMQAINENGFMINEHDYSFSSYAKADDDSIDQATAYLMDANNFNITSLQGATTVPNAFQWFANAGTSSIFNSVLDNVSDYDNLNLLTKLQRLSKTLGPDLMNLMGDSTLFVS